jgi:hypothetical protein
MHDVVVVGAGSAGCVLAERLSRDPDRSVLLLERGPGWPYAEVTDLYHLPVGADAATVGRTVSYPVSPPDLAVVRGHGIGGSAAVNGAYFLRWHRDDFVSWEHPIADIEAAYAEVESVMSASPFADDELPDAARAFEQWWGALLPTRPVGERWPAVGVNRIHSNSIRDAAGGRRVTTAEAFLRPALGSRSGATKSSSARGHSELRRSFSPRVWLPGRCALSNIGRCWCTTVYGTRRGVPHRCSQRWHTPHLVVRSAVTEEILPTTSTVSHHSDRPSGWPPCRRALPAPWSGTVPP